MIAKKPSRATPDKLLKTSKKAGELSQTQLGQATGGLKHINTLKYEPS